MSLVTRCPACATMFKVVPDQIRIAAGWVRCGHCGEVFDASAHMLPYERSVHVATPEQPAAEEAAEPVSTASLLVQPSGPAAPAVPAEEAMPAAAPEPASSFPATSLIALEEPESDPPEIPVQDEVPEPVAPPPEAPPEAAEPAPAAAAPVPPDAQPAPSFVAQAQRRAFWQARPVRLLLRLALLLLALGLALQVALDRRDWLAARAPQLAPALQALCAPLGCRVQPYRQLEAIVIDSSAFNRAGAGSFRFSVTLRNAADLPVASPALELTLTDAQDQPLLRRVVTAAELGAPPALPARGEFSGASTLTVGDAASPSAVVGYRLTAFYP